MFDANTRSWPPESVAHQIGLHLSRFQFHDHDAALGIGDEDTAVELSAVFGGSLARLAVGGEMKNGPVRQLYFTLSQTTGKFVDISDQQVRLLNCRKMPAAWHLGPLCYVIQAFNVGSWRPR